MKIGAKGVQVSELQSDLHKLGYDAGGTDGVFGPKTDAAVKAFQTANKLTSDGIVGPKTQAALTAKVNVRPTSAQNKQLSKNFNEREFACRHCGAVHIEPELIKRLQALRDVLGKPITVTSGYRCPAHNKAIGGAKQSRHMQGQAADLVVPGLTPAQVAAAADQVGLGGIGVYKSGFTHVDIGPKRRWNG